MFSKNTLLPISTEVQPPIDRDTVFFLLGTISSIIMKIQDNPNDVHSLTTLKVFLSAMTLPNNHSLQSYFTGINFIEPLQIMADYHSDSIPFLHGLAKGLRSNEKIFWVDEEDPLLRHTMVTPETDLDADSQNAITFRFDRYNIRWILPKPEVYWMCSEINKIIHIVLDVLEELLHLSQLHGTVAYLYTIGLLNTDNHEDHLFTELITRLMETDVTNILTQALPVMVTEKWSWYANRTQHQRVDTQIDRTEKHFPLTPDAAFLLGLIIAELTDQLKEYMASAMLILPEYLAINNDACEAFFSNYMVLNKLLGYFENIFVSASTKISIDNWNQLISHEFSEDGISLIFLRHCVRLMQRYGDQWINILDKGTWDPDEHKTCFGSQCLQLFLDFFNTNPDWLQSFDIRQPFVRKLKRKSEKKLNSINEMMLLLESFFDFKRSK